MIWFSLPHYGNKNMETSARAPSFSLRSTVYYTVAALTAFSLQSSYATEFSQTPIVGVGNTYPANVVLLCRWNIQLPVQRMILLVRPH